MLKYLFCLYENLEAIMSRFSRYLLVSLISLASMGISDAGTATSIWKRGGDVKGTCFVTLGRKLLMDGPCAGAGHGNTIFVTAERDGCSVELSKRTRKITGKVFAYKNNCGDLENEVELGTFNQQGACFVAGKARLCLNVGRLEGR